MQAFARFCAAQWAGKFRVPFARCFAPRSSSSATTSAWPLAHAMCSAVFPSASA